MKVIRLSTIRSTPTSLESQDWESSLFSHFGIRTFCEGHRDGDGKSMLPRKFKPVRLDCNQWAATAPKVGVRHMEMTANLHDGLAKWPSKHANFRVASSPWKNGRCSNWLGHRRTRPDQDLKYGSFS